jgi:hydrogenase maturation protease
MNVVIGIGNPYRRDDGIGPAFAERLATLVPPDVDVHVLDGEPTALLDAWTGAQLAIVVDAVLSTPPQPGQIHRTNLTALTRSSGTSSHGLGLPEAIELGRALDRLPEHLIIYTVEAADVSYGTDLSPALAAALPQLLDAVLTDLEQERG